MPYFSIETNKKLISGDFSHKLKRTSEFISALLSKPEKSIMIAIKPGMSMMHGGHRMAAAFVELKSIGLRKERCSEFSKRICDYVSSEFQIPIDRIYIAFEDLDREMFGWSDGTF